MARELKVNNTEIKVSHTHYVMLITGKSTCVDTTADEYWLL